MNLIVGGTGTLGSAIAKRLLAEGKPVRVMTRNPEKAAGLAVRGAEVVQGDLLDRSSLVRACRGANTVVAAAHSLFGRGKSASKHVDGQGHRDLIDIAKDAGVRHFLYTSIYNYGSDYQVIPFFRIKYEVEQHLKESGLNYTILRPTAFMESHAHELIGDPLLNNKRVLLFGRGKKPRNFVAADDVAQIAVWALYDPYLLGQTVNVGGPENLTNMDVVRLYEQVSGEEANVTHIPLGMLRISSRLIRPLHPGLSQVMRMGILADTTDQRFDDGPLRDRFPVTFTRMEDWVSRKVNATGS